MAVALRRSWAHYVQFGVLMVLRACFARLGYLVGQFPFAFVLLTCTATALLGSGMYRLKFETRMRDGFTPNNAPSRHETAIYDQFFKTSGKSPQRSLVMILAKDGKSMLRSEHLRAAMNLSDFLMNKFLVLVDDEHGRPNNYTYRQFCEPYCLINLPVRTFIDKLESERRRVRQGLELSPENQLNYPTAKVTSFPIPIARYFYGVELVGGANNSTRRRRLVDDDVQSNKSAKVRVTNMDYVKMITLFFYADGESELAYKVLYNWEVGLFKWVYQEDHQYWSDLLKVEVIGDKMLAAEMVKEGTKLVPYFAAGFVIMAVFVAVTLLAGALYHDRMDAGKFCIAVGTLASPVFAVAATFGFVCYLDYKFYPMLMVIPFLVLAIGVDDAFLMNHAWHRITESPDHCDERVPQLMAAVLRDVGPSITITSLTNTLAFGIGCVLSTPIIHLFCMTTAIAMALDYVFELVFFGSLLAISGRFEKRRDYEVSPRMELRYGDENVERSLSLTKKSLTPRSTTSAGSKRMSRTDVKYKKLARKLLEFYCRLLVSWPVRLLVLMLLVAIWSMAIWGAGRMRTFVSSQKIMPQDTPLLEPDRLLHEYFWKDYHQLFVFVYRPPNPNNETEMGLFEKLVNTFESSPYSKGPEATQLWLKDYEFYVDSQQLVQSVVGSLYPNFVGAKKRSANYWHHIPDFLSFNYTKHWKGFVHYKQSWNGSEFHVDLKSFCFILGFENLSSWARRTQAMVDWRRLAASYEIFNVSIWQIDSFVYDALLDLKYATLWTVGLTFFCMLGVCVLFVPSLRGVVCAGFAIASISLGVIGFLVWFDFDLDPITLAAILMAIGFSVDFTAHVSYHYEQASQKLRLESGLENKSEESEHFQKQALFEMLASVGWPMLQAGLSTELCIVPLMGHTDNTPRIFVASITLVVSLGLLHGLLILPTLFAALPNACDTKNNNKTPPLQQQKQEAAAVEMKEMSKSKEEEEEDEVGCSRPVQQQK